MSRIDSDNIELQNLSARENYLSESGGIEHEEEEEEEEEDNQAEDLSNWTNAKPTGPRRRRKKKNVTVSIPLNDSGVPTSGESNLPKKKRKRTTQKFGLLEFRKIVDLMLLKPRKILPYGDVQLKSLPPTEHTQQNPKTLRERVTLLVENKWFEGFILLTIVVNCITLALSSPQADENLLNTMEKFEYAFAAIFTAEMLLKLLAYRLAYFRDPWNWLDFLVVVLGYLSLIPQVGNFSAIRAFRMLRALRAISVIEGLRLVINSVLISMRNLVDVFNLTLFFLVFFAIVGVQIFAGDLRKRCVDGAGDFDNSTDAICTTLGNQWSSCANGTLCRKVDVENPNFGFTGFDNIFMALLLVLQMVTLDEWEGVFALVRQATTDWATFYFLIIVVVGAMFVVVLVLAVVVDAYEEAAVDNVKNVATTHGLLKDIGLAVGLGLGVGVDLDASQLGNQHFLTVRVARKMVPAQGRGLQADGFHAIVTLPADERHFIEVAETMPERSWFCQLVFLFVTHPQTTDHSNKTPYFTYAMSVVIVLNTIALAIEYPDMPNIISDVLGVFNIVFTIIFLLEMILKLVGFGVRGYLSDAFNIFDGIIVVASIAELILLLATGNKAGGISVFRAFRLLRLFKLARAWVSLRKTLNALQRSVSQVGNVLVVFCIFVMIFAFFGMQLFGGKDTAQGRTNFDNFYESSMAVLRIHLGEWIDITFATMNGVGWWASIYTILVTLFGRFLVMNLFLALLLNNFSESSSEKVITAANALETNFAIPGGSEVQMKEKSPEELKLEEETNLKQSKSYYYRLEGKSLFIFGPENRIRLALQKLVMSIWFERIILGCILLSSAALGAEEPHLDPESKFAKTLTVMGDILSAIFLGELIIKVIVMGFVNYAKDGWNVLDCFIVIVSIIGWALPGVNSLKSLRTLRALRPLRAIRKIKGLKRVIDAVIYPIPALLNVLMVAMLFWLIFGALGVSLFGKKFYSCNDSTVSTKSECVGMFLDEDGILTEREWTNQPANFDHIGNAFLALLEIATFEGWYDIMYAGIDAVGIDKQPKENHNILAVLYFLAFIALGSLIVLNMFIGVIVDKFNELSEDLKSQGDGGGLLLTEEQKSWIKAATYIMQVKPASKLHRPQNPLRRKLFNLVCWKWFDIIIIGVIVLNVITMMFEHYDQSDDWSLAILVLNVIFTAIFLLEAACKIIALDKDYFFSAWNIFDFSIVVLSLLGLVLDFADSSVPFNPTIIRVARLFRIARLLRIIKTAKGLKTLLFTVLLSLPSLFNVGCILFLLVYIFSVLGMNLFGKVKYGEDFNESFNFSSFGNAMITVFRLSTAAGWNGLFNDLMFTEDCGGEYCDPSSTLYIGPNCECGDPALTLIYFVIFLLVVFMVVVNLYVAVILENFQIASEDEDKKVTKDTVKDFGEKWNLLDQTGSQKILFTDLKKLLQMVQPPLGAGRELSTREMLNILSRIDFRVRGGYVYYYDVLAALTKSALGGAVELPEEAQDRLKKRLSVIQKKIGSSEDPIFNKVDDPTATSPQEEYAAAIIQHSLRNWLQEARRRLKAKKDEVIGTAQEK